MKKNIIALCLILAVSLKAEHLVTITDMYGTRDVFIMTNQELADLKFEIAEERSIFPKAFSAMQKEWNTAYNAEVKKGNKDFPKFPTKLDMKPRSFKSKGPIPLKAAEAEYAKQRVRIDAEMTALAAAKKAEMKAAKGKILTAATDNKAQRKRDRDDMRNTVQKKIKELIEKRMSTMTKYGRPICNFLIIDPVAGAGKVEEKELEKQKAALEAYRERKQQAEELAADEAAKAKAKKAADAD